MSLECIEFLERTATSTMTAPTTTLKYIPDEVAAVADWVKAIIGLFSSLISIYTALVSFFKFYQKLSLKNSLLLGFGPGRQEQVDFQETHEMPVLTSQL